MGFGNVQAGYRQNEMEITNTHTGRTMIQGECPMIRRVGFASFVVIGMIAILYLMTKNYLVTSNNKLLIMSVLAFLFGVLMEWDKNEKGFKGAY